MFDPLDPLRDYSYDDINDQNQILIIHLMTKVAECIKDECRNLRIRAYIWGIINKELDYMINQPDFICTLIDAQFYLTNLFTIINDFLTGNISKYNLGRVEYGDLDKADLFFIRSRAIFNCFKYFGNNFMLSLNDVLQI